MKCLTVNTYDTRGGAARAAYRLHRGLMDIGIESRMLVQARLGDDPTVVGPDTGPGKVLGSLRQYLDSLPLRLSGGRPEAVWGLSWLPGKWLGRIKELDPDVVHLHWIGDGFIPVADIPRLKRPVVWTIHDYWPFTGGCHVPFDCTGYRDSCGRCPQLGSRGWAHWVWKRKHRHWKGLNLTVVAPSRWLAGCARESSLFGDVRVEVIPNGLDLRRYRPVGRDAARRLMGLPADRKIILFGAMNAGGDRNKGLHLLLPALRRLAGGGWAEKAELVVFGSPVPAAGEDTGISTRYAGRLHDDVSLALLYSCADVLVAPSIQENLSCTVMEAMACGTPCVAFGTGGMPDLIDHMINGYLAKPFDTGDLARGMEMVIGGGRWEYFSGNAREKAEREYSLDKVARSYVSLYNELLR